MINISPEQVNQRPKVIAFDCGGTLLHPNEQTIREHLTEYCISAPPNINLAESLTRACDMDKWRLPDFSPSNPFHEIWSLLSGISDARAPKVLRNLLESTNVYTQLGSDVIPTFTALRERGYIVAVLANDNGELESEVSTYGLTNLVDLAVSSKVAGIEKPNPKAFHMVSDSFNLKPSECWYIGDSIFNDYLGSLNAGFARSFVYDRYSALGQVAVSSVTSLFDLVNVVDDLCGS